MNQEEKRRQTQLNRCKRELEKLRAKPALDPSKYQRERDYKRACTLRGRCERVLRKQIAALEAGKSIAQWHEMEID
jgi:hypothetical protein